MKKLIRRFFRKDWWGRTCGYCKYQEFGTCRRYPPQGVSEGHIVGSVAELTAKFKFPPLDHSTHCGEFKLDWGKI